MYCEQENLNDQIDTTFFNENGFQIFKNVIPIEVINSLKVFLQSHIEYQVKEACSEIQCHTKDQFIPSVSAMVDDRMEINMLSKRTRDTITGHFSVETRLAHELWQIPLQSLLKNIVKKILNTDRLFLHMPPVARFILPYNHFAIVPPHQDISYNKHMSDFVTVWVPLVDVDEKCGGVAVYQGSGNEPEIPTTQTKNQFWLQSVPFDRFSRISCQMNAGDVLFLNKWIIHESMPNYADHTRISIDFRFFGYQDKSSKPFLDLQNLTIFSQGTYT